jgi:hypothetical protein
MPKVENTGLVILTILVVKITLSPAEYRCMVLQAPYKKATIIGSEMISGADCDVTGIKISRGYSNGFFRSWCSLS